MYNYKNIFIDINLFIIFSLIKAVLINRITFLYLNQLNACLNESTIIIITLYIQHIQVIIFTMPT